MEQGTPYLKKAGHTVFVPTLAGPDKTRLADHISDISEVCSLTGNIRLENVIIAGHSYGLMVITGTADRVPEPVARLVYLISAPECDGNG